jgi:hypothetical protein
MDNIISNNEIYEKGVIKCEGDGEGEKKEYYVTIKVADNYIHFKSNDTENEKDQFVCVICYKDILFFALKKEERFILINYSQDEIAGDDDDSHSHQIKFYPNDKEKRN